MYICLSTEPPKDVSQYAGLPLRVTGSSKSCLLVCEASDVLGMATAEAGSTIQDISWFLGISKKK